MAAMQCEVKGCSHQTQGQCTECSRYFCSDHIEKCDLCQANVCFECREQHIANNPLHEEGEGPPPA
jgi:hypothetical protein